MNNEPAGHGDRGAPPSNAFAPVRLCWICTAIESVAQAAWRGEDGLELRDWLSVTASGMQHRMNDHSLNPAVVTAGTPGH